MNYSTTYDRNKFDFTLHMINVYKKRTGAQFSSVLSKFMPGSTGSDFEIIDRKMRENIEQRRELSEIIKQIYEIMLYIKKTYNSCSKVDIKIVMFGIWKYNNALYKRMENMSKYVHIFGTHNEKHDLIVDCIDDIFKNDVYISETIYPNYPDWLEDFSVLTQQYNSSARIPFSLLMRI